MKQNQSITSVQGLRLVAAIAVLFAHVQSEIASSPLFVHMPVFTLVNGGMGVDIFFIISGFIMYLSSYHDFAKKKAVSSFIIRRLIRVVPMYYISTLMLIGVAVAASRHVHGGVPSSSDIVHSLLFIPYANSAGQVAPILKLGWTLNYEMYFYTLFSFSLLFDRKRAIILLAIWLIASIIINRLFAANNMVWRVWFDPIVLEFLAGIGIAALYKSSFRLSSLAGWSLAIGGVMLAIIFRQAGWTSMLHRSVYHGLPAALIVTGVVLQAPSSLGGRFRSYIDLGGDASFALYLFHPFVIRGFGLIWAHLGSPDYPHLLMSIIIIVALGAAIVINRRLEIPINRWMRRFVPRRDVPLLNPAAHAST